MIILLVCNEGAGGEPTPELVTSTTNKLYNMTGRDTSDWLVKTTDRLEHFFMPQKFIIIRLRKSLS